ncbi:uncharacterized protein LOC123710351 isoform X1 [Pieris brassicae]|uniref:uncharacterized protein LOC123710351 isoform X1 n=1 Tax=Pieris brassicae TaxID=7116 RepID=UPI001E660D34|nr:uncharacterized protein LOC123710351 isoform X1 [Pieris brassicae]
MNSELLTCLPNPSFPKVVAMKITLQDTIRCFRDLAEEYDKLNKENMDYKSKFQSLEEKCNCSQDSLKKELQQKNYLIQQVASALKNLLETKDLNIIDAIFKIICSETKLDHNDKTVKEEIQDESLSEIAGTPGRKSPIILMSKKVKSNTASGLSLNKKSEETRETPEKCVKLIFPSPSRSKGSGRLKQSRLNVFKEKSSLVVDLTCSPEALRSDDDKCNVKKEITDYDETILPSPTSGPFLLPQMFKSMSKDSPSKFKKPQSPPKLKLEETENLHDRNRTDSVTYTQYSIDLMKHCRRNLKINKSENEDENMECDANDSLSLLHNKKSPQKAPLSENHNVLNTQVDMESSLSILQRNARISPPQTTLPKRTKLELLEPVYKEPTLRKKSDKRALPGWSCDNCMQFYGTLYADNPDMLAQKMEECSKHRGRNNPIRPSTPNGFWDIRWDVPTDTEEFNRRNNAV